MPIEVELFDDPDAIARDAAGALDRDRQASLYDSIDWLRLTAAHAVPGSRFLGARARGSGGSAWLWLKHDGGRRAEAYASWYTLAFAPVFAGDADARLLAPVARALARRFDRIALEPLLAPDPVLEAFAANGWEGSVAEQSSNWVARTDHLSFDDYWRARPSRLRNTVKRKSRDAELEVRLFNHFDNHAWSDYERVYAESWKPAEGSPSFMRAFAEQAGAWGALRLGIASRRGDPVAAQLWTIDHGIATIHKLAYAESAKSLSPGSILSHAMFRHVIDDDRPRLIDFGTGDDGYKAEWMDEKRPLYRLELFNRTTIGGRIAEARAAASALVRRLRSG